MPYFVFEIRSGNDYTLLGSSENYRQARQLTRDRRESLSPSEDLSVRMIFAADPQQGQALLSSKREARPLGEDG